MSKSIIALRIAQKKYRRLLAGIEEVVYDIVNDNITDVFTCADNLRELLEE